MADADPLVIAPGNGLERDRNGGSGIRAAIALRAAARRLNAQPIALGGGNSFPRTMAKLQRPDLVPAGTRTLNITNIGRHPAEDDSAPPLRALVISGGCPQALFPQGGEATNAAGNSEGWQKN
jgi:hypothetical protein